MKIHRLLISLTIAGLQFARAEDAPPANSAEKDIRSILQAQQEAWNHGDIDAFMNGYAHSNAISFVSEDKVTRGWDTVKKHYHKTYADRSQMGQLVFSDVAVTQLSNDAAIAVGHWKLYQVHDEPRGRFTLLFRLTDNGWRIVYDHTSAAPTK